MLEVVCMGVGRKMLCSAMCQLRGKYLCVEEKEAVTFCTIRTPRYSPQQGSSFGPDSGS